MINNPPPQKWTPLKKKLKGLTEREKAVIILGLDKENAILKELQFCAINSAGGVIGERGGL
jgi:hypothetical protein